MSLGIYIHIPFCIHKCNYCDFNSGVADEHTQIAYTEALCREIEFSKVSERQADTVYFGGGTPTVLPPQMLVKILNSVRNRFVLTEDCEITTECNPATVDRDGFEVLRNGGINRISMGMQSADDGQLKILGRIHSFEDCRRCIEACRAAGFDNVSLDLMSGIPEQDEKSWMNSLKAAVALGSEHMSCYSLRVEEGTPFAKMKLNIADDEASRRMYDMGVDYLRDNGYERYEISNFSVKHRESRHNCKYWKCNDFIGFGAGAYSCVGDERFSNITDTRLYIDAVNRHGSAVCEHIPLTTSDKMSEFVFLGLRMDRGIDVCEFEKRFSADIFDIYGEEIEKNIKRKTMTFSDGRLKIASDFIYVSNIILADFV